ncbi:MAG: transposase [Lewinellaceae bacterium]|nr:transposase [Saprospiraceae bacterium]MCB9339599.1 transposase [Lewinellaceae bacterium]
MNKYRIHDQQGLNYLTLTTVGWVDVFAWQCYRDILIDSLKYCQGHKGLEVCGYVVMSNHIHLIAQTQGYDLSDVLRDFKKFTSKAIIKTVQEDAESRREWMMELFRYYGKRNGDNKEFQVWQQDNHPVALWSLPVIWQKLGYIHLNPVRAGWVAQPEYWLYSSAPNYMGGKGLLEVSTVEPIGPVLPLNW